MSMGQLIGLVPANESGLSFVGEFRGKRVDDKRLGLQP
jgi:hypothetical protein